MPVTTGTARSRLALALLGAVSIALGICAPAVAENNATKILEACAEGKLPAGYTQQAYRQALKQIPPELSEYSDCADLIHRAQRAVAAGGVGGGGSLGGPGVSGSVAAVPPPTPAEQHILEGARHTGSRPVRVDGEVIHPGVVHANIASAFSTLPTPLLALLAFLLACALPIIARAIHNRVRARRPRA